MDVVAEVKAVSDTQLQVTLSKPSNNYLYKMSTRIGAMMSGTGVTDTANKPVGTGPYVFGEWKRGDSISLKANPDYWGTKPFFQDVTFKYFKDPSALNNALLTGTIDVVGTVQAPELLQQFENNDKYEATEGTTNGEVVLSFNNGKAPMNDLKVRQAVRYAINHQALLDTCWPAAEPLSAAGAADRPVVRGPDRALSSTTSTRPRPSSPRRVGPRSRCGCACRRCPTPPRAAGRQEPASNRPASRSRSIRSSSRPCGSAPYSPTRTTTCRSSRTSSRGTWRQVFGNPEYYTRYDNKQLQADLGRRRRHSG